MSPRTDEANELIHANRRRKILETALGIFADRGYEGTRIQAIAELSGFSYGLVYHYFPSKDAVFTALVGIALEAAQSLISLLSSPSRENLATFARYATADPSPLYFAVITEALTKKNVPAELSEQARIFIVHLKTTLTDTFSKAFPNSANEWKAEGLIALLLGTSIMRVCGISDGVFIGTAAALFAQDTRSS